MNYKLAIHMLGKILVIESIFMGIAFGVSLIYRDGDEKALLISILITFGVGFIMSRVKARKDKMFARDGMMIVALSWVLLGMFGALPMYISGSIPKFVDAFFESVSGFTTTGSSVISNVEAVPRGILFWRSLSHWFGGMGVLVFSLALIPSMNGQTQHLMKAESPGPKPSKLVPKIKESSIILYGIYTIMTTICIVLLIIAGMPVFDSFIHGLGAAGTGGFSMKNTSVGYYNNAAADIILSVFMILFGVNFSMYFLILKRNFKEVFHNDELRLFLLVVAGSTIAIMVNISGRYGGIFQSFRYAFFQVSTLISTTGYATTDFNLWPVFSKCILLAVMFLGSCAGSTAGGIKQIRIVVLLKALKRSVKQTIHPRSVITVRAEGKKVDTKRVMEIGIFFFAYMLILGIGTLLVSLDNYDIETTFTAVLATTSNIGPGIGLVGPNGNFSIFSDFSTWILSFCMLAGRLEIFPMLILLMPSSWRRA